MRYLPFTVRWKPVIAPSPTLRHPASRAMIPTRTPDGIVLDGLAGLHSSGRSGYLIAVAPTELAAATPAGDDPEIKMPGLSSGARRLKAPVVDFVKTRLKACGGAALEQQLG